MFDITEKNILCPRKQRMRLYGDCLSRCDWYPCSSISESTQRELEESPFTERIFEKFDYRRKTMYIGLQRDSAGELTLTTLPKEFTPETGAPFVMEHGIVEVYQVSKIYVPQVKLVLKSQEERKVLREQRNATEQQAEEQPKRRRRK